MRSHDSFNNKIEISTTLICVDLWSTHNVDLVDSHQKFFQKHSDYHLLSPAGHLLSHKNVYSIAAANIVYELLPFRQ